MFKKALLSTLFTLSTLATAQVQLDFDITIQHQAAQRHITSIIVVDENMPKVFEFDDITLIFYVDAHNNEVLVTTDVIGKTVTNEFVSIAKPTIKTTWNETASVSLGNPDSDSLELTITPSQI